jgi:PcfK-like protein
MKSTDQFKQVIESHLKTLANSDKLFYPKFSNPEKNIDDCITYILNTVKKSGCNGFADDEIFSMAIHYYDEESIEVGKPVKAKVIVNHSSGPVEQPKQKEIPREKFPAEKPKISKKVKQPEQTLSLF